MANLSPLDDPRYAEFAWARYRRLMRWMTIFTLLATLLVLGVFWLKYGWISIHFYIATGGAIVAAILLTAALMGLVFLSSGTGHDESIDDPFADEAEK
jgi:hypothetical protein